MKLLITVLLTAEMSDKMAELKVVEKFVSINGEGTRAGQLAVFIRLAYCNLNCSYCDTKWANAKDVEYKLMNENEIYEYIKSTKIKNVTVTGGEPLLCEDVYKLLEVLAADKNIYTEIETNGAVDVSRVLQIKSNRPSLTIDYKLPSSNMEQFMIGHNFELVEKNDTVKFVSGSMQDLERALQIIKKYNLIEKCSVFFSPVFGKIKPSEIVGFMIKNNLNGVNVQLQLHKFIWKPDKRGV